MRPKNYEPTGVLRFQRGTTRPSSTTKYIWHVIVYIFYRTKKLTFSMPRCPSVSLTFLCCAGVIHFLLTKTSMTSVKSNSSRILAKWLCIESTSFRSVKKEKKHFVKVTCFLRIAHEFKQEWIFIYIKWIKTVKQYTETAWKNVENVVKFLCGS